MPASLWIVEVKARVCHVDLVWISVTSFTDLLTVSGCWRPFGFLCAQALAVGGVGSIIRVMTARKTVWRFQSSFLLNMAAECTDEPLLLLGTDSFFFTGAQYFFFFFWTSFLNFPLKLWNFPEIWRAGSHAGWCWHLTLHVCASSADTFHRLLSTPASDCFTATVLPLLTPPSSSSSSSDGEVDFLTCFPGFVLWWSSFPLSYSWLFSWFFHQSSAPVSGYTAFCLFCFYISNKPK